VPLPAPSDVRFRVQGRRKDRASLPRKAKAQVPKFNQSSTTKWSTATRAYGLECFARAYEPKLLLWTRNKLFYLSYEPEHRRVRAATSCELAPWPHPSNNRNQ